MSVKGLAKPHIWRERGAWWVFCMGVRHGPLDWSEVRSTSAR